MRVLLALTSFLAMTSAADDRIKVTPSCADPATCPLLLTPGLNTAVVLTLSQPPICDPSLPLECSVVVLLDNSSPEIVAVNPCAVKWTAQDWFTPRTVTLTAVQNFNLGATGLQTVNIVTRPAIAPASLFYKNFDPNDIQIKSANGPSAQCRSTGDPHYTTFDGGYWHFYDGRTNPKTLVNVVVSGDNRPFGGLHVQTQVRGYPAMNCALAGREGANLIIIDVCSGHLAITTYFNDPARLPRVEVTGSTYTVYFASGFWMRAETSSYYMNVYLQVPGFDKGAVCGMCGNFNDNPADDFSLVQTTLYSQLLPCAQVLDQGLWAWTPPAVTTTTAAPNGAAGLCNYTAPAYVPPLFNNVPGTDITQALIDAVLGSCSAADVVAVNVPVLDPTLVADTCNQTFDAAPFREACETLLLRDFNKAARVAECIADVTVTGNLAAASDMVGGMANDCAAAAAGNSDPSLQDVFCVRGCSGHGTCVSLVCECDAPWQGGDCSHDSSQGPTVTGQCAALCDVAGVLPCPTELTLQGTNFYNTHLQCLWADSPAATLAAATATQGVFLGAYSVTCAFTSVKDALVSDPAFQHHTYSVKVTNDGVLQSTNAATFTFYNSLCTLCTAAGVCTPNPDSCIIDNVCYANGHVDASNQCQVCDATTNAGAWSLNTDPASGLVCGPIFGQATYEYDVQCFVAAGTQLVSPSATNPKVPAKQFVYSIVHNVADPNVQLDLFAINQVTGVISAAKDLDYAALTGGMAYNAANPKSFNGFFKVVATDAAGNFAEANVIIGLQGKVGPGGSCDAVPAMLVYTGVVLEDAAIGSAFMTLPGSSDQHTFAWWFEDVPGQFALDATTGVVSVLQPLNYALRASFFLQAQVTDNAGLWTIVTVNVNVSHVQAPPSGIVCATPTVPENSPNTPVCNLVTLQGTYPFTYTVSSPLFVVDNGLFGNVLRTVDGFDYETTTSVDITVTVTDAKGKSFARALTIVVTNVDEVPVIGNIELDGVPVLGVNEDLAIGQYAGFVQCTDPDQGDSCDCGIVSGNGADYFYIDLVNQNALQIKATLDFESAPVLEIGVVCVDNFGLSSPKSSFTLQIYNVNDKPASVTLVQPGAVVENTVGPNQVVGTLTATDIDSATLVLSVSQPVGGLFTVGPVTCTPVGAGSRCTATLFVNGPLDFEGTTPSGVQPLSIYAFDGELGEFFPLTVTVGDVNEKATSVAVQLLFARPRENLPSGTRLATLLVHDADDNQDASKYVVSLPNSGNRAFKLGTPRNQRRSTVIAVDVLVDDPAAFDFELATVVNGRSFINFTLAVDDGSGVVSFPLALQVFDGPVTMVVTTPVPTLENATIGTFVATVTLTGFDTPTASTTWSLVAGGGQFSLAATGTGLARTATLTVGGPLSYVAAPNHQYIVTIRMVTTNPTRDVVNVTFPVDILFNPAQPASFSQPAGYVCHYFSKSPLGTQLCRIQATAGSLLTLSDYALTSSDAANPTLSFLVLDPVTGWLTVGKETAASTVGPTVANYPVAPNLRTATVTAAYSYSGVSYKTKVQLTIVNHEACQPNSCAAGYSCLNCDNGFMASLKDPAFVTYGFLLASNPRCGAETPLFCNTEDKSAPDYQVPQIVTSASSGDVANVHLGTIAGVSVAGVALVFIVIFVIVVVRRRQRHIEFEKDTDDTQSSSISATNPFFSAVNTPRGSVSGASSAALDNPMYEWYQPNMTRKEVAVYLHSQPDGAFVIRDSAATPGWHMLAVKNGDDILHEKIRFTEDGMYELLPSDESMQEPAFPSLVDLVEHYLNPNANAPYHLVKMEAPGSLSKASAIFHQHSVGHGYLMTEPAAPIDL